MKNLIKILLLLILFSSFVQAKILEPERHSDITFAKRDSTYDFIEHNGLVYTIADDGVHGLELWVFDETYNSLRMVKDINPNGDSRPIVINNTLNAGLLFYAIDEKGKGLWLTDGTDSGTKLLHYFYPIHSHSAVERNYWSLNRVYKDEFYFYASGVEDVDYELWKTDGTSKGTVLVKDLNPNGSSLPSSFHIRNGKLLFYTNRGPSDIWSTDGTEENTIKITNRPEFSSNDLRGWNSSYDFFIESLGDTEVLWSTDGTIESTSPLTNKFNDYNVSYPTYRFNGNKMYMQGTTKDYNKGLLVTDGTYEGTKELKFFEDSQDDGLGFLSNNNGSGQKLFFRLYRNNGLWVTDGTEKGTVKISPNEINYISSNSVESDNSDKLFFVTFDEVKGEDLWVSDGTAEGTKFVKNLSVGNDRARIEFSDKVVSDKVLFLYENDKGVKSIWITDGTEAGTYILNFELRNLYRMFYHENVINDILYFREMGNDNTFRLWRTDMTEEGTYKIMPKDQKNDVHVDEYFSFQIEYKDNIYFFADYYGEGRKLYRIPNTISSVEENPQPELMTVYPNPAKDFIQLELEKPMQLSIINSTGAKVKDYGIVDNGKLNVAELSSGVYFVVDELDKNIAKFVKE